MKRKLQYVKPLKHNKQQFGTFNNPIGSCNLETVDPITNLLIKTVYFMGYL